MMAARRNTPATIGPAMVPGLIFDDEVEAATEVVEGAVLCVLEDCAELAEIEVVLTYNQLIRLS